MRDLAYYYNAYALHPDPGAASLGNVWPTVYQAHRAMRNAVAIGYVLRQPVAALSDAEAAILRIEEARDERDERLFGIWDERRDQDPGPRIASDDLARLLALTRGVSAALADALDERHRARGVLGARAAADVADGGEDAVFEYEPDGSLGLRHRRMPLGRLIDTLRVLAPMLAYGLEHDVPVVVTDDEGWTLGDHWPESTPRR